MITSLKVRQFIWRIEQLTLGAPSIPIDKLKEITKEFNDECQRDSDLINSLTSKFENIKQVDFINEDVDVIKFRMRSPLNFQQIKEIGNKLREALANTPYEELKIIIES